MDDIWIISWFNHTAFDANPIWKSPKFAVCSHKALKQLSVFFLFELFVELFVLCLMFDLIFKFLCLSLILLILFLSF